ncbi:hypothetical protein DFH09DRAFT_198012 [Mycena vulgaris]|nr:hypothetical protein DFH09DRAFT_198012 [Mycena vulgaris]
MYFVQTGLELAISSGNTKRQSQLLATLALIESITGDYSAAQRHAYESQRLAKISADLYREAWALQIESTCWHCFGSYQHSLSLSARARNLLVLCGMSEGSLDNSTISNQAEVHLLKSEYMDARNIHTQTFESFSGQNQFRHAMDMLNIAQIDIEIEASRDAVQKNIDAAISLFTEIGYSTGVLYCDTIQAALHLQNQEFMVAETLFSKCLRSTWMRENEAVTFCLERLGDVHRWNDVHGMSSLWTILFLVHSLKLNQKLEICKALQFLGDIYLTEGDQNTAISLLSVALEGIYPHGCPPQQSRMHAQTGRYFEAGW